MDAHLLILVFVVVGCWINCFALLVFVVSDFRLINNNIFQMFLIRDTFFSLLFFIFPRPFYYVRTSLRSGVTAGSSPPSPLWYALSFLSREEFSTFFPRRLASDCAYPLLSAFGSWCL